MAIRLLQLPQTQRGNSGVATITFDVALASHGKLTITGATTVAFTGWPTTGTYAEYNIELVNGSAFAVTWPAAVKWVLGDGTTSTTFADMSVTLQASGTNRVKVWSTDGGTTVYGMAS